MHNFKIPTAATPNHDNFKVKAEMAKEAAD